MWSGFLGLGFEEVESALWKDKKQSTSRIFVSDTMRGDSPGVGAGLFVASRQSYVPIGGQTTYAMRAARGEAVEKKLLIHFYGEAELICEGDTWSLSQVRIEKRPPDTDTLVELIMVGRT
jgi:hypothetical protein